MASLMKSMEFGLKSYLKEPFAVVNNKSNFGKKESPELMGVAMFIAVLLLLGGFVLGWYAVERLCRGSDTRSKNIRLGLYAILLFTGGQVGWLYVLLTFMKVNICA
jgi:hypothetical protein